MLTFSDVKISVFVLVTSSDATCVGEVSGSGMFCGSEVAVGGGRVEGGCSVDEGEEG